MHSLCPVRLEILALSFIDRDKVADLLLIISKNARANQTLENWCGSGQSNLMARFQKSPLKSLASNF